MNTCAIHIPTPSIAMQSLRAFQHRPVPQLPATPVVQAVHHLQEVNADLERTADLLKQRQVGKSVKAAECIKAYTRALRGGSHG